MRAVKHITKTPAIAALVVAAALLVPSSALAGFERPLLSEITGTPEAPFAGPGGLAVDSAGDLWVDESPQLDEFDPSGTFIKQLPLTGAQASLGTVALDPASGRFFLVGGHGGNAEQVEVFNAETGGLVERWASPPRIGRYDQVAVDSATGAIYLSESNDAAITKFSSGDVEAPFAGCASCSSYVSGAKITGYPEGDKTVSFENPVKEKLQGVAVDAHGDIYAMVAEGDPEEPAGVYEYRPTGEFVRAFSGAATRGLGESHEGGGWGGQLQAVAIDPTNEDVLVSMTHSHNYYTSKGESVIELDAGAVDEFDSEGRFLGQVREGPEASLHSAIDMTVNSDGDLYLTLNEVGASSNTVGGRHAIVVYGPGHFVPALRLAQPSGRSQSGIVLAGAVDPESSADPEHPGLTACGFEYTTEAEFDEKGFTGAGVKTAPCAPSANAIDETGALDSFHPVSATLTGLASGTTYRYRLSATLGGAKAEVAKQTVAAAFTVPHPPRVESTSVDDLSSEFADLHATIDPLGAPTSYQFQYLTLAQYDANGDSFAGPNLPATVPAAPVAIGAGGSTGSSSEAVAQHLGGLEPATTYEFRVLAENECEPGAHEHPGRLCATPGEAVSFTTLPAAATGLPDGRAYELLTPPDKEGAEDMFGGHYTNLEYFNEDDGVLSDSGEQFLLKTHAAFGSSPAAFQNAYMFSRDAARGGWAYRSLAVAGGGVQSIAGKSVLINPMNFALVAFGDNIGSGTSEAGASNYSLLGAPGGPYATLHVDSPGRTLAPSKEVTVTVGASRDLEHVVLATTGHTLCPLPGEAATKQDEGSNVLCDYSAGSFTLLDVNSGDKLLSRCGAVLGARDSGGGSHNAVSPDGSAFLFTAPDPAAKSAGAGCWDGGTLNPPQLYRRSGASTVELSAPQKGVNDPTGTHPAEYAGAGEDGSRVYFITETWLTANHPGVHDLELYEWRSPGTAGAAGVGGDAGPCAQSSPSFVTASQGCLVRVSVGGAPSAGSGVWTVPSVAAEGDAVYFTAFGSLALGGSTLPEPEHLDDEVSVNLYRYDTVSATTSYVTTLSTLDYVSNYGTCASFELGPTRLGTSLCPVANWYTTPDGRFLLFASSRELTGYSTLAPGRCKLSGTQNQQTGNCEELYRYDAEAAAHDKPGLVCVSCDPSGAPPVSDALFARSALAGAAAGSVRAMSDDGSMAFFDTADPLVPEDSNGTLDVYEWEADSTGACRVEAGCVSLLSSGKDPHPSFFLGSGADGANVFFGTHAKLLAQDTDSAGDLYDARICTGAAPCFKAPSGETAQCEGGACQTPPPAPVDATPSSLTFAGPGDVFGEIAPVKPAVTKKAIACKRDYMKRKVDKKQICVKRVKRGKQRAKRSNHGRGSH